MSMLVQPRLQKAVNLHDEDGKIINRDSSGMQYLILYTDKQDGTQKWETMTGRREVYEHLKEKIDEYDLNKSYIMSEKSTILSAATIREFLVAMADVFNDDFDVEGYEEREEESFTQDPDELEREDQLHLARPTGESEDI